MLLPYFTCVVVVVVVVDDVLLGNNTAQPTTSVPKCRFMFGEVSSNGCR